MPNKSNRRKSADTAKSIADIVMHIIKFTPLILMVMLAALCVYFFVIKGVPYEEILDFKPNNYIVFTAIILLIYALKSLSIVFPIVAIYVFVGNSYSSLPMAFLINAIGISIVIFIPYFAGKISGSDLIEKLQKKYPKLSAADKIFMESQFFSSFFLRVIGILPGDIISMMFGTKSTDWRPYYIGSFLGYLPSMISTTLVGATITDPTSKGFILSVSLSVILSVASIVIHRIIVKKKN